MPRARSILLCGVAAAAMAIAVVHGDAALSVAELTELRRRRAAGEAVTPRELKTAVDRAVAAAQAATPPVGSILVSVRVQDQPGRRVDMPFAMVLGLIFAGRPVEYVEPANEPEAVPCP